MGAPDVMAPAEAGPPKTPWFRRGFWIVVLLIVFPPAGAVLAWQDLPRWPKPVRWVLAAWSGLWALYFVYVVSFVVIKMSLLAAQGTPQLTPTQVVAATVPTAAPALPRGTPPQTAAPQLAAPIDPTAELASESTTAPVRLVVRGAGAAGLSLRSTPGTGDRLKVLPDGEELIALGEEQQVAGRSWKLVKDTDGTEGWVAAEFLGSGSASIDPAP
jgi:hypothetical protein